MGPFSWESIFDAISGNKGTEVESEPISLDISTNDGDTSKDIFSSIQGKIISEANAKTRRETNKVK